MNFTEYYRRGLLLGLTMAEIMMLIFFILLIIFTVSNIKQNNKIKYLAAENNKKELLIKQQKEMISGFEKIESVDNIEDIFHELAKFDDLEKKFEKVKNLNDEYRNKLDEFDTFLKKASEIIDQNSTLSNKEILARALEYSKSFLSSDKAIVTLTQENVALKTKVKESSKQIAHLIKKQKGLGKGADYPPCWISDQNKIQYIYKVTISDLGILISDIPHKDRTKEKQKDLFLKIPKDDYLSTDTFLNTTKPLFDQSNRDNCRHFVRLYDKTTTKNKFKNLLLAVENRFYKYLVK